MITQQTEIKKHEPTEFFSNANSQRAGRLANRYLSEIPLADAMWREQITDLYLKMLAIGHKHGRDGSLLQAVQ